ncbi:unnamed protein product [Ixodes pacificus]
MRKKKKVKLGGCLREEKKKGREEDTGKGQPSLPASDRHTHAHVGSTGSRYGRATFPRLGRKPASRKSLVRGSLEHVRRGGAQRRKTNGEGPGARQTTAPEIQRGGPPRTPGGRLHKRPAQVQL